MKNSIKYFGAKMNLKSEKGQSLAELVIALFVGGLIIVSAAMAITTVSRNDIELKNIQTATPLAQQELDNTQALSESNWQALYNLQKGSGARYFIIPSATSTATTTIVSGWESILADSITNGLIGYWKFDEGSGVIAYDFTGNGNQGNLTNAPTWTVSSSCRAGSCLGFNGSNNYVSTSLRMSPAQYAALTITAWVKPDVQSNTFGAIADGDDGGYDRGFGVRTTTGNYEVQVGNRGWNTGASYGGGAWQYVAVVYSSTDILFYKDNASYSYGSAGSFGTSVQGFLIGEDLACGSCYFKGNIDDVRVYNRALSAAEISLLYKSAVFNRYFNVDNVSRDSCGAGSITADATTSCYNGPNTAGIAEDPSTQNITAHIDWAQGRSFSKSEYLGRYANKIFDQTDWSGGSGQTGIVTSTNNRYASSTNIATSSGYIRIQGL